jgi:hypothetical protein
MSEARKLCLSPLEKLVPFDVMRSFDENESRVVAIAARWEFLPTYAGYLVILYVCWIVDNLVDSGLSTNVCRLENLASACSHVLLLPGPTTRRPDPLGPVSETPVIKSYFRLIVFTGPKLLTRRISQQPKPRLSQRAPRQRSDSPIFAFLPRRPLRILHAELHPTSSLGGLLQCLV